MRVHTLQEGFITCRTNGTQPVLQNLRLSLGWGPGSFGRNNRLVRGDIGLGKGPRVIGPVAGGRLRAGGKAGRVENAFPGTPKKKPNCEHAK